ncbi:KIR-like protein [Plasmodium coatneyi]|uniref:KIR-like protein n=1 Tax=Plasmodium coatneyi TaxID=208452 RepID=A0A1B1DTV7_9APIC|nr:KIR-like protein [Plasmodium coatneyi]ANQ06218.1 KIR-like protein [Plasmodium coatneyi]
MSTTNCWWDGSSQSRYQELEKAAVDNGACKGCNRTKKSALEHAVQRYGNMEKEVGNMMNAWCYIHTKEERERSMYCDLFYYWLGEILFREVKNDASVRREAMEKIYEKLQGWKNIVNCTKAFPKVTEDEFKRLKALYHYTQDYSEVEKRIREENSACGEEYKKFLKEANDTYRDRDWNNRCKGPNNRGREYCTKIQEILRTAGGAPKDPSEILPELKGRLTPLESEKLKDATVETPSGQGKEGRKGSVQDGTPRDKEQPQEEIPPAETTQDEAVPLTAPTPPTTITPTSTPAAPPHVETTSEATTPAEGTTSEGTTPSAPEPEGTTPEETATPAPVEKIPAKTPVNSFHGKGDSRGNQNGAEPPVLAPEVQTTQRVTTEAQTTQLEVTETWTSEESSNTAVDLSIGVTEGITIPTTPILFATWVVTVFISIVVLLCKYTSLFCGKKKQSPKSKRRKRRSTIEDELNTSLACSDSATEYFTEGSSIASSTTVDGSAVEVDSMEDNDMEDVSSSSLYSTAS